MVGEFVGRMRSKKPVIVLAYLSGVFFPFYACFIMDYFNFYQYNRLRSVVSFWELHPGSAIFEAIVIFTLFIILLLFCRKIWLAAGILGFLSYVCAYVNYVKVVQNGDNFYPRDILLVGDAGEIMSFVSCPMPKWFYIGIAVMILWVVFLAVMKIELPISWRIAVPVAIIIIATVVALFWSGDRSKRIVNKFGMSFEDTGLQSSNYKANGFLGAFTINILTMNVEEPEGYSEEKIESLLSGYEETPMAENGELFDVILVLCESFSDLRDLNGVTYSENPLPNYDRLLESERCISGKVYTTALGGGTVRPEFEILTGLSSDYFPSGASPYEYVTSPLDSYVSNYKRAGYSAAAIHLYDKSFYSRSRAYPYVGFDNYYGIEDLNDYVDMSYKRGYASDESTFESIKYVLEGSSDPTFLFAITIQNHQPYGALPESDINIEVTSDILTDSELTALSTYTQGVYDSDRLLGMLADYIDSRERPTVLVFYGDHYPSLGTNFSVMNKGGLFNYTEYSSENSKMMYSTPFVIYSNRELDTGIFTERKGNQVSTYNLLNEVAVITGFNRTPYMNALLDFYKVTPMYNVRLSMDETEEIKCFADIIRYVSYDRTVGKKYSAYNG